MLILLVFANAVRMEIRFHPDHDISVEIFLIMDSGPVETCRGLYQKNLRNSASPLAFTIRIHHDARSSECQT